MRGGHACDELHSASQEVAHIFPIRVIPQIVTEAALQLSPH